MSSLENTVSVIIPTYNRIGLLRAAIESALCQSHSPFEVLVCDDGSTDETAQFVAAHPDPRVRWIAAEGHSSWPGVPRNRGLQAARGTWLAFLDDDDLWLPHKLKSQVNALTKSGCRASSTEAWRYVPGQADPVLLARRQAGQLGIETILQCNYIVCSSAIIHRGLTEQVGLFPEHMLCQDYAFWLRVCCLTNFIYLDEPLVAYRDAPALSVRQRSKPEAEQQLAVLSDFKEWLSIKPSVDTQTIMPLIDARILWWQEAAAR